MTEKGFLRTDPGSEFRPAGPISIGLSKAVYTISVWLDKGAAEPASPMHFKQTIN